MTSRGDFPPQMSNIQPIITPPWLCSLTSKDFFFLQLFEELKKKKKCLLEGPACKPVSANSFLIGVSLCQEAAGVQLGGTAFVCWAPHARTVICLVFCFNERACFRIFQSPAENSYYPPDQVLVNLLSGCRQFDPGSVSDAL